MSVAVLDSQQFTQVVEQQQGVTLVDFFAPWCGPCRMVAPVVEDLAEQYEGRAQVVKVDVDQAQEIMQKYGIRGVPTLMVFKDGVPVETRVGVQPPNVLKGLLDQSLS